MKNLFCLIIIVCLFSCQRKNNTSKTVRPDYLAFDNEWKIDTLIHNDIYHADTISAIDFCKTLENKLFNKEIIDDKSHVERADSILFFKLNNSNKKKLINAAKYHKNYFYLRDLMELNSWIIQGYHNDEHEYLFIVNKNTGKETVLAGEPILSPDGKYFAAFKESCTDLSYLQLYRLENDSIRTIWTKILKEYAVTQIKWKNDSVMYLKMQNICNYPNIMTKYIQLNVGRYLNCQSKSRNKN